MKRWHIFIPLVILALLIRGAGDWISPSPPTGTVAPVPPTPASTFPPSGASLVTAPMKITDDAKPAPMARIYRLLADAENTYTLQAVDTVQGEFRQPRALPSGEGTLTCRLLSEGSTVLASTVIPAPVTHCAVLDPRAGAAVTYVRPAPQVIQIKLPAVDGADRLEILTNPSAPDPANPVRLLATVSLRSQ